MIKNCLDFFCFSVVRRVVLALVVGRDGEQALYQFLDKYFPVWVGSV